jgi:hypothetical protein
MNGLDSGSIECVVGVNCEANCCERLPNNISAELGQYSL